MQNLENESLVNAENSRSAANLVLLTNDVESENYPTWSPDGKRLLYQRGFNGSATYVINADGPRSPENCSDSVARLMLHFLPPGADP